MTLTLKAAFDASPAARLSPGVRGLLGMDVSFTFRNNKSYQEMADELELSLVFRHGTFESDFVVVVRAPPRCPSQPRPLTACTPQGAPIGKGGNAIVYLVRRRDSPLASIKFADKRPLKSCVLTRCLLSMGRSDDRCDRPLAAAPRISHERL